MTPITPSLAERLRLQRYPRASAYAPAWVLSNLMGPNVLWLAESLCEVLSLKPGMRVLDMGCGKAISSMFLAKEFGAEVWATDLWIDATDNWRRITEAGLADRVFPIHAEAHALPFAEAFFDAVVSLDAYHYFGTDDLYLHQFAKFVKPGGLIGIVVPGIHQEFSTGLPEHLAPYWQTEFWTFHSPEWWARHWQRSGAVKVTHADSVPHGWEDWLLWMTVCQEGGFPSDAQEIAMLEADAGRNLGFTRIVAERL